MKALGYFIVFLLPLWALAGARLGGAWTFAPVVLAFAVTPVLDALMGLDERNPDDAEQARRARNPLYEGALLSWVPAQLFMIAWGLREVVFAPHSWLEIVGITVSVGVVCGGGGITVAHELMHRKSRLHRALGELLMTSVSYPHFCIEHVHGHHRRVATPEDPASARLGESFYRFFPRCVLGSLRSAWSLERARCRRKGIRAGSLRDRRTRHVLSLVLAYAGTAALAGVGGVAYFAAQSVVAFTMLEVINYIEHYGLVRARSPAGSYEKVTPQHSWNSVHRVTGWYLFELPRHADHHHLAHRPFWQLRQVPDSPQLPAGYATMFVCALLPPLWRRIMDPRVHAWRSRNLHGNLEHVVPVVALDEQAVVARG